jgi:hypothetical protein
MNAGPVLRDIHLPAEPGLWPLAPGVWLLIAIALLALLWLGRRVWRARLRRLRRHRWLRELERISADPDCGARERVAAASELLRRAVAQVEPARAALSGAAWVDYLAGLGDGADRQQLTTLAEAPFRPQLADVDAQRALAAVRERLPFVLERMR